MIPFLVGAAALVGGVKTINTLDDMSTAKSINREAIEIKENADKRLKNTKESANHSIAELGKTKIGIMSGSMKRFVDAF